VGGDRPEKEKEEEEEEEEEEEAAPRAASSTVNASVIVHCAVEPREELHSAGLEYGLAALCWDRTGAEICRSRSATNRSKSGSS